MHWQSAFKAVLLSCPACPEDVLEEVTDTLEQVQHKTMKVIRALEHLPCEEGLKDLSLFSLEKQLQGDLVAVFRNL